MEKIKLTEAQFNQIVTDAALQIIDESLKGTLKNVGYGALGAAGLLGTMYGNEELHANDEPDPMDVSVKQSIDDFRRQNLEDKAKNGDISYEDALEMFKNGKGYANESFINNIIHQVITEEIKKKRA